MPKIFVSTTPFGAVDRKPLELLEQTGWQFQLNPLKRKLTPEEVGDFAADCDGLIAGTENIDIVLERAKNLKMIARVGIGLDSVPLHTCRQLGIRVSYTPDAVTMAVAELTVSSMIALLRHVPPADRRLRRNHWERLLGRRIEHARIGLIGFGRIGFQVARLLVPFKPQALWVNDIEDKSTSIQTAEQWGLKIESVEKERIYREAHAVSLHVPLWHQTQHMIARRELETMRPDAVLLNFARGGIVDESALFSALKNQQIAGAAVDVFEQEPYTGPLTELDNICLTQHMGSCSMDCRAAMELEATRDMINFFSNRPLENEVPPAEYRYQVTPR